MKSIARISLVAILLAGSATFSSPGASQSASAAQRCAAMIGTQIRPGLTITGATHVPAQAALPAHCRIDGTMDPHRNPDGREFAIGFALALPDDWNGRFLLQGGGGLNGSVGA